MSQYKILIFILLKTVLGESDFFTSTDLIFADALWGVIQAVPNAFLVGHAEICVVIAELATWDTRLPVFGVAHKERLTQAALVTLEFEGVHAQRFSFQNVKNCAYCNSLIFSTTTALFSLEFACDNYENHAEIDFNPLFQDSCLLKLWKYFKEILLKNVLKYWFQMHLKRLKNFTVSHSRIMAHSGVFVL